jgi:hypothetical protein
MNSVERILYYCSTVPQETTPNHPPPPPTWPEFGSVVCCFHSKFIMLNLIKYITGNQGFSSSVQRRFRPCIAWSKLFH